MIDFTVPLIPTAKGRPRFARIGTFVRAYTDKRTEAAEQSFIACAVSHAPAVPMEAPLHVTMTFTFALPVSRPKWQQKDPYKVKHTSKPDIDNLQKLVLDALNRSGRFWRDDAQIVTVWAGKEYGPAPQTRVVIQEMVQAVRGAA